MEDDLDLIANGQADQEPWLARFYFGDAATAWRAERRCAPG